MHLKVDGQIKQGNAAAVFNITHLWYKHSVRAANNTIKSAKNTKHNLEMSHIPVKKRLSVFSGYY